MRAVGIILAGGRYQNLGPLVEKRNMAAIPVGSCYRTIDFTLSNMSHSGIKKVGIIAQHNTQSLAEHLSSSKWWDFGRKKGGMFLFTPHMMSSVSFGFRGTGDAIYQNINFLKRSNEPYVVIAGGEQVHRMDYDKIIDYHESKNADITFVCKKMPDTDITSFGVVELDEDNRMLNFEEKPLEPQGDTVSLGIYVVDRELLIELLEDIKKEGRYSLVNDIIIRYRKKLKIYGYVFEGYWRSVSSVESYYDTSMEFLNKETRNLFFERKPYFYTKVKDEAPAKFNIGSKVINSLMGGGVINNGIIDNSIVSRKVYVGEKAVIRNSIVMEGTNIGENCNVEYAILDKNVVVSKDQSIIGTKENLKLVSKNTTM